MDPSDQGKEEEENNPQPQLPTTPNSPQSETSESAYNKDYYDYLPSPSEYLDGIRRNMTEKSNELKEAFSRLPSSGQLFHVITGNNTVVEFSLGENGRVILKRTAQSITSKTRQLAEARDKLVDAREKLIEAGKAVPRGAKRRARAAITGDPSKRIREYMKEPPQVKMKDKLSFTMGMFIITFTEFIILRHPEWFALYFATLNSFLFAIRFYTYKREKYQFFMLDFCYMVNISTMLQSLLAPGNMEWFMANFMNSLGPLTIAIVAWRNSLVFHSLDKLTSFFLHVFPALNNHLMRWGLTPSSSQSTLDAAMSWNQAFIPAMALYAFWQITYLLATELIFREYLDSDPELTTSMRYLAADKKNVMNKLTTNVCVKLGILKKGEEFNPSELRTKLVFVVAQLVYQLVFMVPPYLVFKNYYVSCVYLIVVIGWAAWNGASYYIEVFSKRYNMKFEAKNSQPEDSVRDDVTNNVKKVAQSAKAPQNPDAPDTDAGLTGAAEAVPSTAGGDNQPPESSAASSGSGTTQSLLTDDEAEEDEFFVADSTLPIDLTEKQALEVAQILESIKDNDLNKKDDDRKASSVKGEGEIYKDL